MSINKTNIRRVIDQIKAEPKRFNMGVYIGEVDPVDPGQINEDHGHDTSVLRTSCGTVACIAGWAAYLARPDKPPASTSHMLELASDFLGVEPAETHPCRNTQGDMLFYGWMPGGFQRPNDLLLSDIAPEKAIKVLEHLIDTGEVDWSIVQE